MAETNSSMGIEIMTKIEILVKFANLLESAAYIPIESFKSAVIRILNSVFESKEKQGRIPEKLKHLRVQLSNFSRLKVESESFQELENDLSNFKNCVGNQNQKNVLVICRTRLVVQLLHNYFQNQGFRSCALFGMSEQTTANRTQLINCVRQNDKNIIFATSVMNEGMDLPDLDLVIKYGITETPANQQQIDGRIRKETGKTKTINISQNSAIKKIENDRVIQLMNDAANKISEEDFDVYDFKLINNQFKIFGREAYTTGVATFLNSRYAEVKHNEKTMSYFEGLSVLCSKCKQYLTKFQYFRRHDCHFCLPLEQDRMSIIEMPQNQKAICKNCQSHGVRTYVGEVMYVASLKRAIIAMKADNVFFKQEHFANSENGKNFLHRNWKTFTEIPCSNFIKRLN